MKAHQFLIYGISLCQSFQTLDHFLKGIRLRDQLCNSLCFLGIDMSEIFPENQFRHTFCHISVKIPKRLCVFLHRIVPCRIQYHLRSILPLL